MTVWVKRIGRVLAAACIGALTLALVYGGVVLSDTEFATRLMGTKGAGASAAAVETREVVDSVGRTVSIPTEPRRIAALDAFSGNVCVLIGAGEQMMGAPGGVLSNELLGTLYPDLDSLEQLSGGGINVEQLLADEVDVVLVRKDLYEGEGEVAKLDKLAIPYVVVDYATLEEQMDAIRLVGMVCNGQAEQRAGDIADYYADTVSLVEERAALVSVEDRKRVYHAINDVLLTDGEGSLGADWMGRVGAENVAADEEGVGSTGDFNATLEQVYVWDPDMIITSTAAAKTQIEQDSQWQALEAVSAGEVYNIPISTSRWGQRGDPETFLAMLWLGVTLYPDYYPDIDLKETVTSYYRDIVGLDIDDGTWDAVLSGEGLRADGTEGGNGSGGSGGSGGGKGGGSK